MPELPEVETVARLIGPRLEGRRVVGARVLWERSLGGVSRGRFRRGVVGATLGRTWRRAKYIVIEMGERGCLVGHLRMTGRMHVLPRGEDPGPYARVSLDLDGGDVFHFIDVRKFGRLVLAARPGDVFAALGPEPLGDAFTAKWFADELKRRRRMLKPLLLDQSFLAGLGNIYVDEALHRARLHPLRLAHDVSRAAASRLHTAIRETLAAAIEREGSSFDRFYRTPEGNPGSYQDQFLVYGRDGQPCRTCGRPIRRIVVGQRGTHVCTRCQRR